LVAAISGAAAVIVFPLLMVGAAFGISGSDTATTVMLVAAFAGAVCALTAAVLGIVSLTRGVTGSGKALAIGAILSAVFSIVTGGLAAVFGFLVTSPALHGRPLRRRGEPVLPRATETDDVPTWGDDRAFVELEVSGLPEETRREVAAGWLEDARTEHASVAAFSRLALDLLAIGAPPRLVTRAHSAAMDEVEHARKAYAIASRFAGRTLEPAAYADASALEPREVSRLSVARESLLEGVVGEAACAALLARGASEASNDVLGRHLARLAVDEAGHAELARDIVRHCVDRAGSERASRIAELRRALDRLVVSTPDETRDLRAYGRFSPRDFALATSAAREEARLFLDGLEASETTARHCASASIGGQDASQE
jgi:hypothetical protein